MKLSNYVGGACFYGSAVLALVAAVMAFGLRASASSPREARVARAAV